QSIPAKYDWVVDCVSSSGGGAEEYRAVYFDGMRNLLARIGDSPPKKFVFTSSTSVYGQKDGSVATETSPAEPEAATARVLLDAEALLRDAARRLNFAALVLRAGGIYGTGRGYWLKQFLKGEPVAGPASRILNMVHRDDVVGSIVAGLRNETAPQILNVVDDEPTTLADCFEWLSRFTRKPAPEIIEASAESRRRGFSNKRVSNALLKAQLNYRFKYPTFRQGFAAELNPPPSAAAA
ncbi:MAG TPA: NAD-dependent epimerase/dehydratase family protein, partial [Verrucomicrobiae bacterium]|nr:NAD-dependent epimerase/dehydratase family protein [Verrucomicrobiae bacterium]